MIKECLRGVHVFLGEEEPTTILYGLMVNVKNLSCSVFQVKLSSAELLMKLIFTAMGNHLLYGITQCYLRATRLQPQRKLVLDLLTTEE